MEEKIDLNKLKELTEKIEEARERYNNEVNSLNKQCNALVDGELTAFIGMVIDMTKVRPQIANAYECMLITDIKYYTGTPGYVTIFGSEISVYAGGDSIRYEKDYHESVEISALVPSNFITKEEYNQILEKAKSFII